MRAYRCFKSLKRGGRKGRWPLGALPWHRQNDSRSRSLWVFL